MNKTRLQENNTELQEILKAVQSLPAAKSWGGGTAIEPSREDIVIPAYTDKELTIKGYGPLLKTICGYNHIVYGSITLGADDDWLDIAHGLQMPPRMILVYTTGSIYTSSPSYICTLMATRTGDTGYLNGGGTLVRYIGGTYSCEHTISSDYVDSNTARIFAHARYGGTSISAKFAAGAEYKWIFMA